MTIGLVDVALASVTLALAWQSVFCRDHYEAVVYFIALGLAVSLAWARLGAPDVAIAEAAIGAGLTGALLIATWRRLAPPEPGARAGAAHPVGVLGVAFGVVLAGLAGFALTSSGRAASLIAAVTAALPASGVGHPVTAVLLNFRSFDTLLEIGVLFLTLVAVRALGLVWPVRRLRPAPSPMLAGLVRLVVPLAVVAGAYLLWAGATAPGGAFQAGAVWAGALVLLRLADSPLVRAFHRNGLAAAGVGVFAAAALAAYVLTGTLLMYPRSTAGIWILVIEVAAAFSIAAILYRLFAAEPNAEMPR